MVSLSSKNQSNAANLAGDMKERLLHVRSTLKLHRPKFIRQQGTMIKRLGLAWRAPKGDQSKVKLNIKGKRPAPMIGYGNPKLVRGLNKKGMREVVVQNLTELQRLKAAPDMIVIFSRTLGIKQRLLLAEYAQKNHFTVRGIPDLAAFIEQCKKLVHERKQLRQKKTQDKLKAVEQRDTHAKKKAEPAVSDEEKKQQEEEEKRKVLEAR